MDAVCKKVSSKLQVSVVNIQDNINTEPKAEGVDNIDKREVIIKEGVQAALEESKEYQVLGCFFSILKRFLPTKQGL